MSALRYGPRRRLRSEVLPLLSVFALTAALVGIIPRNVLPYLRPAQVRAEPAAAPRAGCAFVTLTPEQEAAALAGARASWQSDAPLGPRRVEMLPGELPAAAYVPAIELESRPPVRIGFPAPLRVDLLPPTVAAPPPVRIPPAPLSAPKLPFPREEMLRLH